MKIHKIEISNIASLRGDHSVDFDRIFQESALFAITGKTGSGKSTILNCISLALFGKVYKKDSDGLDFVTLGESQGKVELTFSNLDHKYLASWNLKIRKKNGELYKKPQLQRSLAIYHSAKEIEHIDKAVEDVIGLTFEQFCKTTILNQGQFAKFLTSNFKDRKDILEKFYQGLDLETLNLKLNEKLRVQKALLDESENQIKGHTNAFEHITVTEDIVSKLKERAQSASKTKVLLDTSLKHFRDIQQSFKTIEENSTRMKFASNQIEQEQSGYNLLKKTSDSILIELTKSASDLKNEKPKLLEGIKLYNDKLKAIEHLEYLSGLKTQSTEQLNSFNLKQNNTIKKIDGISSTKLKLKDKFNVLDDENISSLQNDLEIYSNKISESKRLKEELIYITAQLEGYKTDLKNLETKIKLSKEKQGQSSVEEISKKLFDLKRDHMALLKFNDKLREFNSKSNSLRNDYKVVSKNEENKSNLLEQELAKKDVLTDHLSLLKKTLDLYSLTLAIHTCIEESKEKGSCVVCGNEALKDLTKQTVTNQDEVIKAKREFEVKQEKLSNLESSTSQIKLEKLALTSHKDKSSTELKQLLANFTIEKEAIHSLLGIKTIKESDIPSMIQVQEEKITKIETERVEILNIESMLKSFEDDFEKLGKRVTDLTTRSLSFHKKLKLNDSEMVSFEKTFKIKQTEDEKLEIFRNSLMEFSNLNDQEKLLSKDRENLSENINEKNVQIKSLGKQILDRKTEIDQINKFLTENFNNLSDPAVKLSVLEDKYQMQQKEALDNSKELSTVEIRLAELRSKISGYKEQITASKLMIESLKEKLGQEVKNFPTELESKNRVTNLVLNLSKLDSEQVDLQDLLVQLETLFNQLAESAKIEVKERDRELTSSSNDLARKLENENKVKDLVLKSEAIKENLNKLNNLYELIGKDEFRNFILSLIETTLIDQTNKELESLYQGRYSLIQTHKKNRSMSEFLILDYFRDGMTRKVSTLSGGETFLVSLAMALALAELTRGSTEIDSLFIDEGFGTLDQDSIDEVYELLEKIQHSGKQIGIISHVQSLTSRIGININLEKNSLGVSNIDLVYN